MAPAAANISQLADACQAGAAARYERPVKQGRAGNAPGILLTRWQAARRASGPDRKETIMSSSFPVRMTGERPGLPGRADRACYRHRWLTMPGRIGAVACLIAVWTRFGTQPTAISLAATPARRKAGSDV